MIGGKENGMNRFRNPKFSREAAFPGRPVPVPQPDGDVERTIGTWRCEFYGCLVPEEALKADERW